MRKNVSLVIGLAIFIALAFLTVSCANKNVVQKSSMEVSQTAAGSVEENVGGTQPQTPKVTFRAEGAEFIDENIYFEFNSALLSGQAQKNLDSAAQYLLFNPGAKVTVEGHCDERGTEAYNMALGERRAEAVKDYLVDLGIIAERLETISYGEERPIVKGPNEASWAQNRRAQLVNN